MKVNNPILTTQQVREFIDKNKLWNNVNEYNQIFINFGWKTKRIWDTDRFMESLSISELNQFYNQIKQIKI